MSEWTKVMKIHEKERNENIVEWLKEMRKKYQKMWKKKEGRKEEAQ